MSLRSAALLLVANVALVVTTEASTWAQQTTPQRYGEQIFIADSAALFGAPIVAWLVAWPFGEDATDSAKLVGIGVAYAVAAPAVHLFGHHREGAAAAGFVLRVAAFASTVAIMGATSERHWSEERMVLLAAAPLVSALAIDAAWLAREPPTTSAPSSALGLASTRWQPIVAPIRGGAILAVGGAL